MNPTQAVSNFLVPATGNVNAYAVRQTFSATPVNVNFNEVNLDGLPFRPSGIIADNTQGTGPLIITINEIELNIAIPAGAFCQMPYPAPLNHTAKITGLGLGTVVFVDYPVMPYMTTAGGGSIPNPLPVTGPLTDAQLRASAVPVSGTVLSLPTPGYDSVGNIIPPQFSAAALVYAYTGSNLTSITATLPGAFGVYIKTYTYTGSNLTGESAWVKQP